MEPVNLSLLMKARDTRRAFVRRFVCRYTRVIGKLSEKIAICAFEIQLRATYLENYFHNNYDAHQYVFDACQVAIDVFRDKRPLIDDFYIHLSVRRSSDHWILTIRTLHSALEASGKRRRTLPLKNKRCCAQWTAFRESKFKKCRTFLFALESDRDVCTTAMLRIAPCTCVCVCVSRKDTNRNVEMPQCVPTGRSEKL